MSTFKVEVAKLEITSHPQADRLEIAKVKGWQCVVVKDQFKTDDLGVYIPIDSVLPEALVKELGLEKMYNKRVKTVKLRGFVSQGIVMKPREGWIEGQDVTTELSITKWEEPIPVQMRGIMAPRVPGMEIYTDIENIKNFPDAFEEGEMVVLVEKIHGTNARFYKKEGNLYVGSHKMTLQEDPKNLYWRAAHLTNLKDKLQDGEELFGEIFGSSVQDLTYGCKPGEIKVAFFDILSDGVFMDFDNFIKECVKRDLPIAPVIARNKWSSTLLKSVLTRIVNACPQCEETTLLLSHFADEKCSKCGFLVGKGKAVQKEVPLTSQVSPGQILEGTVIRPERERYSEKLQGRLILKHITDEYHLRKGKGTERH